MIESNLLVIIICITGSQYSIMEQILSFLTTFIGQRSEKSGYAHF